MGKYYFSELCEERCYTIDAIIEDMEEQGIKEVKAFEARTTHGEGYFYCAEYRDIGEVGESCGRICDKYTPNNGRNGRCKHYRHCYEPTDKWIILKI